MRTVVLFLSLFSLCLAPVVLAQVDCPAIMIAAIEAMDSACDATGRNQLCYGNITLNATPRGEVGDFQFEQPGDLVGLTEVESLQLSSYSATDSQWGVALMRVQANLPNILPGENVTFLLFGDVNITDTGDQIVEVAMTATAGVNVRQRPSTEASIIGSLTNGQAVTATGRLTDGSWIRVRLDDSSVGWVSADFLSGDVDSLTIIEPGTPNFGAMQAFYFATGFSDAPCQEAPDSGILIQTPQGVGTIELRANNVDISLGSTIYLQAVAGNAMFVSVLEGYATLTAFDETQIVPAGTVSHVPLNSDGVASGAPSDPEPYAFDRLQYLPVYSLLLTPFEVVQAIANDEIDDAIMAIVSANTPASTTNSNDGSGSGVWEQNEVVTFNTCPGPLSTGDTNSWYPNIVFSTDRQTLTYDGGPNDTTVVTLGLISENSYQGVFGDITLTFTFSSSTTYAFSWVGVHGDPNNGGCRFVMEGNGSLVSGSAR